MSTFFGSSRITQKDCRELLVGYFEDVCDKSQKAMFISLGDIELRRKLSEVHIFTGGTYSLP